MQKVTRTEIKWITHLIEKECTSLSNEVQGNFEGESFRELAGLRYYNLVELKQKLLKSAQSNDKRIAIKE